MVTSNIRPSVDTNLFSQLILQFLSALNDISTYCSHNRKTGKTITEVMLDRFWREEFKMYFDGRYTVCLCVRDFQIAKGLDEF